MKKIILLFFILLFSISTIAVESNSTNFIFNSYIGSGGVNYINSASYNASLGIGQAIIGEINNTLYEGIFYIGTENITIIEYNCSSTNLTLCQNSTACISFGGYWYNSYCHPSPQSGGTGSGSPGEIRYIIYPTTFYSTVIQYQAVYKTFYIENHESSSPLTIQIESGKFTIFPTHFTISPGRRAEIDFTIFGSNNSGYINDTLTINIIKTSSNQKQENLTINYYVKNTTIINITEEEKINITEKNATVIDLLPFIKKQPELKADLSRAAKAIDDFIKHPMFLTVVICLLIIVVIIIQQISEKSELGESFEGIKRSPLFYIIIGAFALFIGSLILFYSKMDFFWAKVRILYNHPAFLVIVFSILIILLIIVSQLKRTENNRFKWGKLAIILVISGLFILIIRNAELISRFIYKYPYFYKSPVFLIVCTCIILTILLILYQIHKKNS